MITPILLLALAPAFALQPASPRDKAEIREQLWQAVQYDSRIEQLEREIEVAASDAQKVALGHDLRRLRDIQSAAFTKAVHMTLRAYGIEPVSGGRGTSVMPATKGNQLQWIVVASEPQSHELKSARGPLKKVPQNMNAAAVTYVDGTTRMHRKAFEEGVDALAFVLHHESGHFDQYVTPGQGDVYSWAQREVESYRAGLAALRDPRRPFGDATEKLNRDAEYRLEQAQQSARALAQANKGIKGMIPQWMRPAPPDDFESYIHTDEALERIRRQAADLKRRVDDERQQRNMQEIIDSTNAAARLRQIIEDTNAAAARPKVEAAPGCYSGCRALRALAAEACARPGAVEQAALESVAEQVERVPLPVEALPDAASSEYCAKKLFFAAHERIMRRPGSIRADWINQYAGELRAEHAAATRKDETVPYLDDSRPDRGGGTNVPSSPRGPGWRDLNRW